MLTRLLHPSPPPTHAYVGRTPNLRKGILLNMLIVAQLTKKYSTSYGIRSFITIFPRPRHHTDQKPVEYSLLPHVIFILTPISILT